MAAMIAIKQARRNVQRILKVAKKEAEPTAVLNELDLLVNSNNEPLSKQEKIHLIEDIEKSHAQPPGLKNKFGRPFAYPSGLKKGSGRTSGLNKQVRLPGGREKAPFVQEINAADNSALLKLIKIIKPKIRK
ncbi:hypothetical protein [Psychromonas aquimarina]|uniref:hypothetical protein n=1 Tax=Psychromonas aquimarina TaxID=444919 RepID=UPI000404AEE0|nr:hypothetical protein [Psychromonas aquimarina]